MRPTNEMYAQMYKLMKEVEEKSEQLRGFEPKVQYGQTSLIFDHSGEHYDRDLEMDQLTVLGLCMKKLLAPMDELVRVVKHSMVVHDSKYYRLDVAQSSIDNGITELKKKYFYEAAMMFAEKGEKL